VILPAQSGVERSGRMMKQMAAAAQEPVQGQLASRPLQLPPLGAAGRSASSTTEPLGMNAQLRSHTYGRLAVVMLF
jgi:hypothetical protein